MRVIRTAIGVLLAASVLITADARLGGQTTQPRLSPSDFTYVGAFKLPAGTVGADTFDYAGGYVAGNVYNDPANGKTLFITGYKSSGFVSSSTTVAQVKIPSTIANPNSVGLSGLSTATVVQGFADPSNGIGSKILTGAQGQASLVVYGGKIIGTEAIAYDASGAQAASAWVSPTSFAQKAQASGPYKFSETIPQRMLGGGFMTLIPPEWQTAFGGKVVSGNGQMSIASQASGGPSLHVIDADTLIAQPGTATTIATTPLVYYDCPNGTFTDYVNCHWTLGAWDSNDPNQRWNGSPVPSITVVDPHGRGTFTIPYTDNSSHMGGVLFADGTRSVIFFGHKGLGRYCYGVGSSCGDLDSPSIKGDHAYPYTEFAWFYDANDLLAVKNGKKKPWQVYPYTGWAFKVFGDGDGGSDCCLGNNVGVAWDPATRLAYMVVQFTNGSAPLVHVFKVGGGTTVTTAPAAPANVRIIR
jgi:hypothetical protein